MCDEYNDATDTIREVAREELLFAFQFEVRGNGSCDCDCDCYCWMHAKEGLISSHVTELAMTQGCRTAESGRCD